MRKQLSGLAVSLAMLLAPTTSFANCSGLKAGELQPGKLYLRLLNRGVPTGVWTDVTGIPPDAFSPRAVRLVYVVAAGTNGGVLAIRQRNEVLGPGKDAQVVHIERPAVGEACWPRTQKVMDGQISASEYFDYHNDLGRKHSDTLYRFHFKYKPEGVAECRRTDDPSIEGRTHFRYDLPSNTGSVSYRGATIDEAPAPRLLQNIVAALGQIISAPALALTRPPSAAGMPADLGMERHYVYLRTMLRRYPATADQQASCITFDLDARQDVRTTFISITDLSDPSSISTFSTRTWDLLWAKSDGR